MGGGGDIAVLDSVPGPTGAAGMRDGGSDPPVGGPAEKSLAPSLNLSPASALAHSLLRSNQSCVYGQRETEQSHIVLKFREMSGQQIYKGYTVSRGLGTERRIQRFPLSR